MKTFKNYLAEIAKMKRLVNLFEHQTYKIIPGTKNSYREDSADTNTMTSKHCHVYAKSKGKGKQIYSVNIDGSGHDGSSGIEIPSSHATFFKSKGYCIPDNNILEGFFLTESHVQDFEIIIIYENS
ncbi:MAG: hypothetical protein JXR48_03885 [Candidatus Delongbacteria bacterium]|nr:hypothetical protein [Candidatus Delongbacteria bacterium]MBN2834087.1 hypothetical protein [Candidatus Delongbacteria bacterium]